MKMRCTNPNDTRFHRYGGRGIKVCERWMTSFGNFLIDMGEKPFPRASIDRIDCDGNYEPTNCRWATQKQQGRNTSTNRYLTIDGEIKTCAEWSDISGISKGTLSARLKNGWDHKTAVFNPLVDRSYGLSFAKNLQRNPSLHCAEDKAT